MSDEHMSDSIYRERARLVAFVSSLFPSYLGRASDEEPGFTYVLFVETPVGQLSWHIADADLDLVNCLTRFEDNGAWDGHTTEEKYARLLKLTENPLCICGHYLRDHYQYTLNDRPQTRCRRCDPLAGSRETNVGLESGTYVAAMYHAADHDFEEATNEIGSAA